MAMLSYPFWAVFSGLWWLLLVVSLWEGVWKGIALWKSGSNKHLAWFVCIFIFNTMGILPIIYLLLFQDKDKKKSKGSPKKIPAKKAVKKKKRR